MLWQDLAKLTQFTVAASQGPDLALIVNLELGINGEGLLRKRRTYY